MTSDAIKEICRLQAEIDEYRRVIGDLLITLCSDDPGQFVEHGTEQKHEIETIFREIWELKTFKEQVV